MFKLPGPFWRSFPVEIKPVILLSRIESALHSVKTEYTARFIAAYSFLFLEGMGQDS
jgi:hypothetical protein